MAHDSFHESWLKLNFSGQSKKRIQLFEAYNLRAVGRAPHLRITDSLADAEGIGLGGQLRAVLGGEFTGTTEVTTDRGESVQERKV
jgi:hypothetical protein